MRAVRWRKRRAGATPRKINSLWAFSKCNRQRRSCFLVCLRFAALKMRAVALFAGLAPVAARVYTGTLGSDQFPFMGRFAFGPTGVGSASVSVVSASGSSSNSLQGNGFVDTVWCPGLGALPTNPIIPENGSPVSLSVGSGTPPHFYYYSVYNTACTTNPCPSAIGDTYTLTLKQADGSHLSYEEVGIPAVYGVFWAWTMCLAGAMVWALFFAAKPATFPKELPLLTRVLLVTLVLHALSNLAHLIEWSYLSSTGKPSGAFLAVVGGLLRLAAVAAGWVMAAVIASGYGVSTMSVGTYKEEKNIKGVVALSALILVGFILSVYFGATASAAGGGAGNPKFGCPSTSAGNAGGIWAGLIFLALTFTYLAFVVIRWRATIAAEASLPRKTLLTWCGYNVIASFFILPLAEIIGALEGPLFATHTCFPPCLFYPPPPPLSPPAAAATPNYAAIRVATGIDVFLTAASGSVFVFLLWPTRCADAFQDTDATLLGGDANGALDEAYAYSAEVGGGGV